MTERDEGASPTSRGRQATRATNGHHLGDEARRAILNRTSPEGIVTILFTDIVQSTRFRRRLGDDRAQEHFRQHYQILREQIEKHAGFEVKTQGDGFMVAFSDVGAALDCAIGIQAAVAADNEEHPKERLEVRIGLNCGEAIKEEEDFFGGAVVVAARIGALAKGGQILVSETVRGLAKLQPEVRYVHYGRRRLKGLPDRYDIWAVPWRADETFGLARLRATATFRPALAAFALVVFAGGIAGGVILSQSGGGPLASELQEVSLHISSQTSGELTAGDCTSQDLVLTIVYEGTVTGDLAGRVTGAGDTTLSAADACQSGVVRDSFTMTDREGNTLSWDHEGPGSVTTSGRQEPAATSFTPDVTITGGTGIYDGASGTGTCTILGVAEFGSNNSFTGTAEADCDYELATGSE